MAPNCLKLGYKQNYNTYIKQPPNGTRISAIIMNSFTTFDNIIEPKPNINIIVPIHKTVLNLKIYNNFPKPNKWNKKPDIANEHKANIYPKLL